MKKSARASITLHIDLLEDRCTPADMSPQSGAIALHFAVVHLQPAMAMAPNLLMTVETAPVSRGTAIRTDLFGGAATGSQDALPDEIQPIPSAMPLLDVNSNTQSQPHQEEATPESSACLGQWIDDEPGTPAVIPEAALCVQIEFDATAE